MRFRGVSLLLLALLVSASLSSPPAWAGTCHTTHAPYYGYSNPNPDLGSRSVAASWNWEIYACVPTGCNLDGGYWDRE